MSTIQITTETDENGILSLDYQLDKSNVKVNIIIEYAVNSNDNSEENWYPDIKNNPEFGFLDDIDEDVYTLQDGIAFND